MYPAHEGVWRRIRDGFLGSLKLLHRYAIFRSRDAASAYNFAQQCARPAIDKTEQDWPQKGLRPSVSPIMHSKDFNYPGRPNTQPQPGELDDREQDGGRPDDKEHHERLRDLREAFDCLAPDHRSVLVAVVVEGRTYEEAARRLNIPLATLRSRLARARVTLQQQLRAKARDAGKTPPRRKINLE